MRQRSVLFDAQLEAGRLVTDCMSHHLACRKANDPWPDRSVMHLLTKGKYGLHSQTVQSLAYQVLSNVDATSERRRSEPSSRSWLRYPYKAKRFFPLYWPAQAVSYDPSARRLVLPMGRRRKSLVFTVDLDFEPGSVKLVFKDGYELHVVRPVDVVSQAPGANRACVDLGEIHQAAVVTDTGKALVVSGRGIRSHKRLLNKQLGEIAALRSRCKTGSKRKRRLAGVRMRQSSRARRRIRDARHKGTRRVIEFCRAEGVGQVYVGDPRGVRALKCGRHHNQRIARWEMGKDIAYLDYKSKNAGMACSTGSERGTSSRCPSCGNRQKPKGRLWRCRKCLFVGHRDVVGGANMYEIGFQMKVTFPALVTYRRPGPTRAGRGLKSCDRTLPARRSRTDTSHGDSHCASVLLGTSLPQGGMAVLSIPPGLPGRREAYGSALS